MSSFSNRNWSRGPDRNNSKIRITAPGIQVSLKTRAFCAPVPAHAQRSTRQHSWTRDDSPAAGRHNTAVPGAGLSGRARYRRKPALAHPAHRTHRCPVPGSRHRTHPIIPFSGGHVRRGRGSGTGSKRCGMPESGAGRERVLPIDALSLFHAGHDVIS